MKAAPVSVVVDGRWVPVAEEKGGGGFGGVDESVQVGELDRSDVVDDQAERSAGLDSSELARVTDETYLRPGRTGVGQQCGQPQGAGHPGFIDQQDVTNRQVEERVPNPRGW